MRLTTILTSLTLFALLAACEQTMPLADGRPISTCDEETAAMGAGDGTEPDDGTEPGDGSGSTGGDDGTGSEDDGNCGHGNDDDHDDEDNPGRGNN